MSRKIFFIIFNVFYFSFICRSQVPAKIQNEKLSPVIQQKLAKADRQHISTFSIVTKDRLSFLKLVSEQKLFVRILKEYEPANVFIIEAKWADLIKLLNSDVVTFADEKRAPKEELTVSGFDLSANKVNAVHSEFPQWNGDSVTLSVKENIMDTTDIDLKGRFQPTALSSATNSPHAGIVATMIAGGGNSSAESKGVAWGATITSSDFTDLLPDSDSAYQQYKISVQNHSYGTGIENFYGADAAAYDASTINNPSLLHIFSSGNAGTSTDTVGTYAGVENQANLTGSFKMAKNIITVGSADSLGVVAALSSKGPAYDGRVKPELVAFGIDGSSGAAAVVSGISILLQQAYKQKHSGELPSSALIKAILLNSADDVEEKNIDFKSGFGNVNAYKAMETLSEEKYLTGNVINGGSQVYILNIPGGSKQLKLTLVWNDAPAAPNASKALVNDLDLELQLLSTSQRWKPWVLNYFPHPDSLMQSPQRKRDSLNNVEQITLDNPAAGNYAINVSGFSVSAASQPFFIAYQLDSADTYKWYYPTKIDNLLSGSNNILRWESNYSLAKGQLEYSTDGNKWPIVNSAVDLTKGYYQWNAPDTFSIGVLRMKIDSKYLYSDTFTISRRLNTFVGFNCADSVMFGWNKAPGINNYQLYKLGNKYLEPLSATTDTVAVISKAANPSLHYTIAPLIDNKTGLKSYTFNYITQGVECYVKTFFAESINASVKLDLELGTIYQVKNVTWEKATIDGYSALKTVTDISGLQFSYSDMMPTQGVNTYRAKIETNNGQIIYSHAETIYYLNKSNYVVYPNPTSQYNSMHIISKEVSDAVMQIFNTSGVKVMEKILDDVVVRIPAGKLGKGLYFIRIIKNNKRDTTLKLIVH